MRITFDTNTLDKACRPERFPKDPNQFIYQKVHDALEAKSIHGFYSVTLLTVESIIKVDRSKAMASSRLELQTEQITTTKAADLPDAIRELVADAEGVETIEFMIKAVQPDRPEPHPEFNRRLVAGKALGLRMLRAPPRIGAFFYSDPNEEFYVTTAERGDLAAWIDKVQDVATAIEARGVGYAQLKALGVKLASAGGSPNKVWFKALADGKNIHQQRAVERAFSEWADGDSIASHIAYGIDIFCSADRGGSNAGASILDEANRKWLAETYGVRFMTMQELASAIA